MLAINKSFISMLPYHYARNFYTTQAAIGLTLYSCCKIIIENAVRELDAARPIASI